MIMIRLNLHKSIFITRTLSPTFHPIPIQFLKTSSLSTLKCQQGIHSTTTQQSQHQHPSPPVTPEQQTKQDFQQCIHLVQTRDYDGYLIGLLYPPSLQKYYFTLRAFNAELASIKSMSLSSTSTLPSLLKIQYWNDALTSITTTTNTPNISGSSSSSSNHSRVSYLSNPVIRSLHTCIQECNLSPYHLKKLITSRQIDIDRTEFESTNELIQYVHDSCTSLYYLQLELFLNSSRKNTTNPTGVLGVAEHDDNYDALYTLVQHMGIGVGLANYIRGVMFHTFNSSTTGQMVIPLPRDIMMKYDIPIQLFTNPPPPTYEKLSINNTPTTDNINNNDYDKMDINIRDKIQLSQAIQELTKLAQEHLFYVRNQQHVIPKEYKLSFYNVVTSLEYLQRVQDVNYDLFHIDLLHPLLLQHHHYTHNMDEYHQDGADNVSSSSSSSSSGESLKLRLWKLRNLFWLSRTWLTNVI